MKDKKTVSLHYLFTAMPVLFVILVLGFKFLFDEALGQAVLEGLTSTALVLAVMLVSSLLSRRR